MNTSITIRPFNPKDLPELIKLFQEAVYTINIRHYSLEQVKVWTHVDQEKWHKSLAQNITFIAEADDKIVGFADISHEGIQFINYHMEKKLE